MIMIIAWYTPLSISPALLNVSRYHQVYHTRAHSPLFSYIVRSSWSLSFPDITTMKDFAPKPALQEKHEELDVLDRKAQTLIEKIKKSKHFIVFTGAATFTSADKMEEYTYCLQRLSISKVSPISVARKAPGHSEYKEDSVRESLPRHYNLFRQSLICHLSSCRIEAFWSILLARTVIGCTGGVGYYL